MAYGVIMSENYFRKGNELLQQHKTEDAIAAYHKAISLNPGFYPAYLNLGEALLELGHHHQFECLLHDLQESQQADLKDLYRLYRELQQPFAEPATLRSPGILPRFPKIKLKSTSHHALNQLETQTISRPQRKLPITVLVISWDVGHNPLGRAYMLAEVVQRVARHTVIMGFQFPRYGKQLWEPVSDGQLPVISIPGSNFPDFNSTLERIKDRIKPDVVIACKSRFPSVYLGLQLKQKLNCPVLVDVDDHELSFFKNKTQLNLSDLEIIAEQGKLESSEPYEEIWTRLTENLLTFTDEILVSNRALQKKFGGVVIPHVRDETRFDPKLYDGTKIREHYNIPKHFKIVLFFGTPRLHKGLDTLAEAVNAIEDEDFRLLIVGTTTDRSVTNKLDNLAPGRIIYLPNQPFNDIPKILSMANVVCLPQNQDHAISKYQLPAKAIDAIAMGVPLLVSRTEPLMDLIDHGVAQLIEFNTLPQTLEQVGCRNFYENQDHNSLRDRFLSHYSYQSSAKAIRQVLEQVLSKQKLNETIIGDEVLSKIRHLTNRFNPLDTEVAKTNTGVDIVIFWKQNDTGLYGRRHDMILQYLASRPDVRKVLVIDSPMSEFDLIQKQVSGRERNQDRWIYIGTYEKLLGKQDESKISYTLFVYPPGIYQTNEKQVDRPKLTEGYIPYLEEVFLREHIDPSQSIFWIYPKNYFAPEIVRHFNPRKVVVDVVDDHRCWPNTSEVEKARLAKNYQDILDLSDMTFANCQQVLLSMQEFCNDIRLVPNGCDTQIPIIEPKNSHVFKEFCDYPGKTIGYIGNLESKIDIELIQKLATTFQDCQIVLIGSTHANPKVLDLKRYQNVRMPGVIPYREVGAWVSRFNVGIVPHLKTELTNNMNPLKVFVYLALDIPVVSTKVSNIDQNCEMIKIASSHEEFLAKIQETLIQPKPCLQNSKNYVQENNWEVRFSKHIDELLQDYPESVISASHSYLSESLVMSQSHTKPEVKSLSKHGYNGICTVCGHSQEFEKANRSLREGYRCDNCKASLRYQGQAEALVKLYSLSQSSSLAELCQEKHFQELNVYEPGITGSFRTLFRENLKHYATSFYWDDVPLGEYHNDIQCQDLENLIYPDLEFDLIITSDIFEHIRRPWIAFKEVYRVLKPGGYHVFSIPVQDPLPKQTIYRVDVSGTEDIHLLEPRYHGDGQGNSCIVYTDFGADIVDSLKDIGYHVELCKLNNSHPEVQRLITFVTQKPQEAS